MIGQRFGSLKVVEFVGKDKWGGHLYRCVCRCGNEKTVLVTNLRSGNTRSCGCLRNKATGDRSRRHGLSRTPTHRIWKAMIERCYMPTNSVYSYYGGRGIEVCDRWRQPNGQGFVNFLADMGERPAELTLDRIDNEGDYEPTNCRWATMKEQRANRRDSEVER